MTFDELLNKVRDKANEINLAGVPFMAIQVNIAGKNGGIFYVEIKDGKANIEPYEYNDRSCVLIINQANFLKLLDGKLDPELGYTTQKFDVEGDLAKALEFSKLIKK